MPSTLNFVPATIVEETTHKIVCPACHKPSEGIDHVVNSIHTQWYCNVCGARYAIKREASGAFIVATTGAKCAKTLVLLRRHDVLLVVQGFTFDHGQGYDSSNDPYFYNEHTCPTNYMKQVLAVVNLDERDTDPHGIFEHVATLPWDARIEECNHDPFVRELVRPYMRPE